MRMNSALNNKVFNTQNLLCPRVWASVLLAATMPTAVESLYGAVQTGTKFIRQIVEVTTMRMLGYSQNIVLLPTTWMILRDRRLIFFFWHTAMLCVL